jgi:hypothetical protein
VDFEDSPSEAEFRAEGLIGKVSIAQLLRRFAPTLAGVV